MKYALREEIASGNQGRDLWFHFWTAIGPKTTADPNERMLFDTREDAVNSRASRHWLTNFQPVEVEDVQARK